jgi:hypothetical protein
MNNTPYTKTAAKLLIPGARSVEAVRVLRNGVVQVTYIMNGGRCSTFLSAKAFLEVNFSRRQQAAEVIEIVEIHGEEVVVKSSKKDAYYCVRLSHPDPYQRCDCGDCHFRGVKCKHQIKVEAA